MIKNHHTDIQREHFSCSLKKETEANPDKEKGKRERKKGDSVCLFAKFEN